MFLGQVMAGSPGSGGRAFKAEGTGCVKAEVRGYGVAGGKLSTGPLSTCYSRTLKETDWTQLEQRGKHSLCGIDLC